MEAITSTSSAITNGHNPNGQAIPGKTLAPHPTLNVFRLDKTEKEPSTEVKSFLWQWDAKELKLYDNSNNPDPIFDEKKLLEALY